MFMSSPQTDHHLLSPEATSLFFLVYFLTDQFSSRWLCSKSHTVIDKNNPQFLRVQLRRIMIKRKIQSFACSQYFEKNGNC